MTSVEALRRAICEEEQQHRETIENLRRQHETLRGFLEEQRRAFQELISRVTNLRMARGDFLANNNDGKAATFNTGSTSVDAFLGDLYAARRAATLTDDTLLDRLSTAAKQAATPSTKKKTTEFSQEGLGSRSTSILFVMRNEIRGMQPWMQKHYKKCSKCAAKRCQLQPWDQVDDKAIGTAAAPNLRHIPGKNFYSISFCVKKLRHQGSLLDVLRVSLQLIVKSSNGGNVTNSVATQARVEEIMTKWARKLIDSTKEAAKKAPWNEKGTENLMVSGAVDMFLHSVDVRVKVSAAASAQMHGTKVECIPFIVDVAITKPAYLPTIEPFINLLGDADQRSYIYRHIVNPLAQNVGELIGMPDLVLRFARIGYNAVEALYRMTRRDEVVNTGQKSGAVHSLSSSSSEGIMTKIRSILDTLEAFGTSLEIDCAVPQVDNTTGVASAKQSALSLAQSFLQFLVPPRPVKVPPVNDPMCADLLVQLKQAPTSLLQILNSAFSSNKRLPSTSRVGVVDFLASPKAKIRYALKIFSEIVVDIYRPYAPVTGVVIADENGKNGKPKASGCTPVADMPRDIVRANVAVTEKAQYALDKLRRLKGQDEQSQASDMSSVAEFERNVGKVTQHIAERVCRDSLYTELMKDIGDLHVEVVQVSQVGIDVWIPSGHRFSDVMEDSTQLLYAHFEGRRGD